MQTSAKNIKSNLLPKKIKPAINKQLANLSIREKLFTAWRDDNRKEVESLLAESVNSNEYLLHAICGYGDINLLKVALNYKFDANKKDKNGNTPLHKVSNEIMASKLLYDSNTNIDAMNHDGNTILHISILDDNRELVELLLNREANINVRNNNGDTPLHIATKNSNEKLIDLLLSRGANTNAKNDDGNIPLFIAAKDIRLIKIFVDKSTNKIQLLNKLATHLKDINTNNYSSITRNNYRTILADINKINTVLEHVYNIINKNLAM